MHRRHCLQLRRGQIIRRGEFPERDRTPLCRLESPRFRLPRCRRPRPIGRPGRNRPPAARKSTAFRPARRSMVPGAIPFVVSRNFPRNNLPGRVARSPNGIPASISAESSDNSPPSLLRDAKESPARSSATNSPMGIDQLTRSLSATTISSSPSNDKNASVDAEFVEGSVHTGSPGDSAGPNRRVSVSSSSTRSSTRPSSKGSTVPQELSSTSQSSSFASSAEKSHSTLREENSLTRSSSRCSVKEGSHSSNSSQIDFEESISDLINNTVVPAPLDERWVSHLQARHSVLQIY